MTETKQEAAPEAAPAAPEPLVLKEWIECDHRNCGARAKGRAVLESGPLYFCGHHGRELLPMLAAAGAKVEGDFALRAVG